MPSSFCLEMKFPKVVPTSLFLSPYLSTLVTGFGFLKFEV